MISHYHPKNVKNNMLKLAYIDTETTGLDCTKHWIHQLSLIIDLVNDNGEITTVEKHNFKIKPNPSCEIDQNALDVSGVTVESFELYDSEEVFHAKFVNILKKYVNKFNKKDKFFMVGFNTNFDSGMLNELFKRCNDDYMYSWFWFPVIDVALIALGKIGYRMRTMMPSFKLGNVCEHCGIKLDNDCLHDAMYDIEITRDLLLKLKWIDDMLYAKSIMSSQTETQPQQAPETPPQPVQAESVTAKLIKETTDINYVNATVNSYKQNEDEIDDENYVITFGKYKGYTIYEIIRENASYILWIQREHIRNMVFSEAIMKKAIQKGNEQSRKKEEMRNRSDYRNFNAIRSTNTVADHFYDNADAISEDCPF